ncbi:unnamed protein product [Ilex paraguariensis]|uniref:Uncharacterized protein n=1 Tax=Ilex paraguariensis TaxID=185542 RepID=A0ABC8UMA9_9AQUA
MESSQDVAALRIKGSWFSRLPSTAGSARIQNQLDRSAVPAMDTGSAGCLQLLVQQGFRITAGPFSCTGNGQLAGLLMGCSAGITGLFLQLDFFTCEQLDSIALRCISVYKDSISAGQPIKLCLKCTVHMTVLQEPFTCMSLSISWTLLTSILLCKDSIIKVSWTSVDMLRISSFSGLLSASVLPPLDSAGLFTEMVSFALPAGYFILLDSSGVIISLSGF